MVLRQLSSRFCPPVFPEIFCNLASQLAVCPANPSTSAAGYPSSCGLRLKNPTRYLHRPSCWAPGEMLVSLPDVSELAELKDEQAVVEYLAAVQKGKSLKPEEPMLMSARHEELSFHRL